MIKIVPIEFPLNERVNSLVNIIEGIFHCSVEIVDRYVDPDIFYDSKRCQYNSTSILKFLEEAYGTDRHKILGITNLDLFIPILTFVFGEAQLNGISAVASSFRLDNTHYGLPMNNELLHKRLEKEIIHELGHTFGLVHCQDPSCVMRASTYMEELDYKLSDFCQKCHEILSHHTFLKKK